MSMKYRIVIPAVYTYNYPYTGVMNTRVAPTNATLRDYMSWCKEHVGANGWNYYGEYRKIPFEFRFKRGEDLVAFRLTFGLH